MKKVVYLSMLLLGMTFVGCSSDGDEPEPAQTADSAFVGKFNVEYYDGDGARKVGEGFINNINGIFTFGYIPAKYIIPKMMPEGKDYTLVEGHVWGGEYFSYLLTYQKGQASYFTLQKSNLDGPISLVSGTYDGQDVMFTAIYDDSYVYFYKKLDALTGFIMIKGLLVINPVTGKEVDKIELSKPYELIFNSTSRVSE